MKTMNVYIYRSVEFDGNIYVKVVGTPREQTCQITLYKEASVVASSPGLVAAFHGQEVGLYKAAACLTAQDGTTTTVASREVNMRPSAQLPHAKIPPITHVIQAAPQRYDDVVHYYLHIKFENKQGVEHLRREGAAELPLFFQVKDQAVYTKVISNTLLGDLLPDTYTVDPHAQFDDLVIMADELERLDYVSHCWVSPDTTHLPAPDLPQPPAGFSAPRMEPVSVQAVTPDFQALQTYMLPGGPDIKGMNTLLAWRKGEIGSAATVRHLDFGVYRHHEDLQNITVVNSRPETSDCNHGTASTGCVAASANSLGVVGIAHDCDFYFYDTGDLDLILRDAVPGDIVSLDIQVRRDGIALPMIDSRDWWDKIHALTQHGVVVILAAANGGVDIGPETGHMNQFGDSGSMLVGACEHTRGTRLYLSNHHHSTSLVNSWGDWSVVTTGYGSLQREPGNERNYSRDYSGTSSATPLTAGALALIQSFFISQFGFYLDAQDMRSVIHETGYTEAAEEGIGRRPNVGLVLSWLSQRYESL